MKVEMKYISSFLILFVLFSTSACVKRGTVKNKFAPSKPVVKEIAQKNNGAIYQQGMVVGLFEDTTARNVGDNITIELMESATALASSNTKTEKSQNVELPPPKLAGEPVTSEGQDVLNNEIEAGRDFRGGGESDQSHSFQGVITVTVADVLPNGYLVVRGEKLISLNQSEEFIQFSGIVRPQDIDLNNTVESRKVGNVRISYAGKGVLNQANEMGPLARFFQSSVYPF